VGANQLRLSVTTATEIGLVTASTAHAISGYDVPAAYFDKLERVALALRAITITTSSVPTE
jgi:hypothetical protein